MIMSIAETSVPIKVTPRVVSEIIKKKPSRIFATITWAKTRLRALRKQIK